jgi:hypothetical protein
MVLHCCHTPTLACDPMLQLLVLTCIGWRDEMVGFSLKKWDGRAADEWVHINKKVEYMLNCVKYRLDSKLIFRWLSLTINHAYWTSYKHKSCKPANWKQLVTLCYFSHVPFLQLKAACRLMLPHLMLPAAARKKLQEKSGSRGTGHTAASPSVRVTCHMQLWSTVLQTTVLPSRLEKNTHHETLRTGVKMKFQRRFMVPVSRRQQVPDWEHTWRHKSVWVATTAGWAVTTGDTKSCLIYIFCRGNSVKFTISMHMCKNQVKIMCTYVGGVLSIFLFWRHSL